MTQLITKTIQPVAELACLRSGPTILMFSSDASLMSLAERVAAYGWKLERCDDILNARGWLSRPQLALVILDDEGIEEQLRGWLLTRIQAYAPQAPLIYVAGDHSDSREKRARAYAASYYTSKPVDAESFSRVLGSFVRKADSSQSAGR